MTMRPGSRWDLDHDEAAMTRSILFVPGDSPRKFERAAAGVRASDTVCVDLDDGAIVATQSLESRRVPGQG